MRLIQQPDEGIAPLIGGIDSARAHIEILIFRFDQREIEKALANAVARGVTARALIAHVNGSGEESLRRLEMRLLAAGVTVARTADDFARYHAKLMVIDHKELWVLAFNWTHNDIERSRSFGVVTKDKELVEEALTLFEADMRRQRYQPKLDKFVVSPANSRKELGAFIKGARKELLIYDPKVSDSEMLRLLEERAKAGVDIRIIGELAKKGGGLAARKLLPMRLHTRSIVRDRERVFVGSQSLRGMELDNRREVGILFEDADIVKQIAATFEKDWEDSAEGNARTATRVARKVARALTKDLPPIAPIVEGTLKEVTGDKAELSVDVEEAVRVAVKEAVKGVIEEAVQEVEVGK